MDNPDVTQLENFRLKVFRTVAEHLSFRKAAEQLFLTQPAVTLQIRALEDDLGVRLFDRTAGRVSLTPQGVIVRALWIVPLSVVTSVVLKSKSRIQWPRFILFFCLAALLNTLLPVFGAAFAGISHLGRIGLTVTLFLIGTGLNRQTLLNVAVRPLL